MATVPGNIQHSNKKISPQTAKKTKAYHLSKYNDDESSSNDEHPQDSETEYKSASSSSEEEVPCRRHKRKTKERESIKRIEDANWWFKNHGLRYSGLKDIKPTSSF